MLNEKVWRHFVKRRCVTVNLFGGLVTLRLYNFVQHTGHNEMPSIHAMDDYREIQVQLTFKVSW